MPVPVRFVEKNGVKDVGADIVTDTSAAVQDIDDDRTVIPAG